MGFHRMPFASQWGYKPSTLLNLLKECLNQEDFFAAKLLHAQIIIQGRGLTIPIANILLSLYVKSDDLQAALTTFHQMPRRDVCSWTTLISAYAKRGFSCMALALFNQMLQSPSKPNKFTFASVLSASASPESLQNGIRIHSLLEKAGIERDLFVENALIDMYAKCRRIHDARKVFDRMTVRDTVSWTSLIGGYAQEGLFDEAMDLFHRTPQKDAWLWTLIIFGFVKNGLMKEGLSLYNDMQKLGIIPNKYTYVALLSASAELSRPNEGIRFHKDVISRGLHTDILVQNSLIVMYVKCGRIKDARQVFDLMSEPDIISWTSIIGSYAQTESAEEALALFRQMQDAGVRPDPKTIATILPACANLGALQEGTEIHAQIERQGFHLDPYLGSGLVDMYCKCGYLQKAMKVFESIPEKSSVTWATMIAGFGAHGHGREAIAHFEKMISNGICADASLLLCVLSACCHSGLVDEGLNYFNSMEERFGVVPTADHYSCIIDLFGRAGQLDRALEFVKEMHVDDNLSVWNSVMSVCRLQNNAELGEYAAKRVLEIDPRNASAYLLLSSIYASKGRWHDFERIRRVMRSGEVVKSPGCSWLEINRDVHAFVAGNR